MALKRQDSSSESLGKLIKFEQTSEGLLLHVDNATVRITVYNANMIRVNAVRKGKEFENFSYAIVSEAEKTKFTVSDSPSHILLITSAVKLEIKKDNVRMRFLTLTGEVINEDHEAFGIAWMGTEVTAYRQLQKDEKFIGLGEKTGNLDRKGLFLHQLEY